MLAMQKKTVNLKRIFLKGLFSFNSNGMTWILKDDLCTFKIFAFFQKNMKEMLMEQID